METDGIGEYMKQNELVAEAFSRNAVYFDEVDEHNPIVAWARRRVREHFLSQLKPGSHILELNAGTGLDASYLIRHGHNVLATDNAPGMLEKLSVKAASQEAKDRLKARRCSFEELHKLDTDNFDAIFSNFGGLNCSENLEHIISQFRKLLKVGGMVTLVIMPPVCPWELLYLFRGKIKLAFRRLNSNGARSHLGGVYFQTYYYRPSQVIKYFGNGFELAKLESLGLLVPPPYMANFPKKLPKVLNRLIKLEKTLSSHAPFNAWGDYFILSMRYKGT